MSASLRLLLLASTVVVLAAAVRIHAAGQLRQDWDEDNYFRPAQLYAAAIRAGDMGSMFRTPRTHAEVAAANLEHPPLPKLLFAVALMTVPPAPIVAEPSVWRVPRNDLPRDQFAAARSVSVALGVLGVAVLAVADPLAAVILATHTWHVKYTSEVMLEAPAALASLVAVLCYLRARTGSRRWVVLSGVAVGLTIASKYVYGLAAVAIVLDHALGSLRARSAAPSPPGGRGDAGRGLGRTRFRRAVAPVVLWAGVSVGAFVAANPYLWSDPVQRLVASVRFHPTYAGSVAERPTNLPPWQPLVWITQPVPAHDGNTVFRQIGGHGGVFLATPDTLVALVALAGARRTWRERRVFLIWLLVTTVFLLLWPTKWPQYTVALTVPLSVVAADGIRSIWSGAAALWRDRVAAAHRSRVVGGEGA